MEETIKMSRKEKRHYLGYLVALYAGAVLLLAGILFAGVSNPFKTIPESERAQLAQARQYEQQQVQAVQLYDSLMSRINQLKQSPGNAVLETDIENQINYLNSLYDGLPNKDIRSFGFHQMARYLQRHYQDAVTLRKRVDNIQIFQNQLNDCMIGYREREGYMNQMRAAEAGR